jgi:p-aminobenzoyl-glutamate transporter AbgT
MSEKANAPAINNKNHGYMKIFNAVERAGNKLPHPFYLFIILAVIVMILSAVFAGATVTYVAAASDGSGATETTVSVINLFSRDYLRSVLKNITTIYTGFAPLGLVMVMMLSIGFAQDSRAHLCPDVCDGWILSGTDSALLPPGRLYQQPHRPD